MDVPDAIAAVLQQSVGLQEGVPGGDAPVALASGGDAVVVAEVSQFVE